MNRSKLVKTLISLVLLWVVVMIIASNSLFNWRQQDNDFRVESHNKIVKVILTLDGKEPLVLERQKDGKWLMNQTKKVNDISIRDLLDALNLVTTRQPVSRILQDEVNDHLESEGTIVSVFVKKHLVNVFNVVKIIPVRSLEKRFVVGNYELGDNGTCMKTASSENPYVVHLPGSGVSLSEFFSVDPLYWLDPVVVDLQPDQISSIEVNIWQPDEEIYKIESYNNDWLLTINQQVVSQDKISTLSTSRFLDSFKELYYEQLLVGQDSIKYLEKMITPMFMQVLLHHINGCRTTLEFFRKEGEENITDPDRFFLVVNGQKLSLARYFVFNRIIKPSNYFLK